MTAKPETLSEFIAAEVLRQSSGDAIRARIEKNVDELIGRTVDDAFRSYGDVGQQIDKLVKSALALPDRMEIQEYGHMVMSMLRSKLDERLSGIVDVKLAKQVEDLLKIAPAEIKLSEIVELIKRHRVELYGERDAYGRRILCDIEEGSGGYCWISLDEKKTELFPNSSAEVRIGVNADGQIFSLTMDGYDASKAVIMNAYPHWKKILWGAFIGRTVLVVDEDAVERRIGDD